MGDTVITGWIEKLAEDLALAGPVLEVGSWRSPSNKNDFFDYRGLFPEGTQYIGTDFVEGLGVDLVWDWSVPGDYSGMGTYQTVISTCTLEHVKDPFQTARNMMRVLKPGGTLIVSVPFVWVIHAYPDDYWRFTPSGVRMLFPSITFDNDKSCVTTPTGRTVYLSDAIGMRALDYIGIRYGTASSDQGGFLTPVFLVQPGSFVSEGVNVNMVGHA